MHIGGKDVKFCKGAKRFANTKKLMVDILFAALFDAVFTSLLEANVRIYIHQTM